MSRMLSKMNLISVVQQLPKEDIETIQGYVEMVEQENNVQKVMIENFVTENQELKKQIETLEKTKNQLISKLDRYDAIVDERDELKKSLDYLRSGEYYNQLRFERDMLQDLVYNGEISKEDKEFIDMTHRNTELLEQQKEFIEYMTKIIEELESEDVDDEEMKGYLIQRIDTFKEILSNYKKIIGDDK